MELAFARPSWAECSREKLKHYFLTHRANNNYRTCSPLLHYWGKGKVPWSKHVDCFPLCRQHCQSVFSWHLGKDRKNNSLSCASFNCVFPSLQTGIRSISVISFHSEIFIKYYCRITSHALFRLQNYKATHNMVPNCSLRLRALYVSLDE